MMIRDKKIEVISYPTQSSVQSPSRQIAISLAPWRWRVWSAHLAAVLLGMIAAMIGVLIGPAMQILLSPNEKLLLWRDLLGPTWAQWLSPWLKGPGLSAQTLYSVLPFALVGVATMKSLLTFWQWQSWEWLGERVAFQWRARLVKAFVQVSPWQREQGAVEVEESDLGGLISQDIRTCRDYVVHFFGGLPREGLQVVFMAVSLAILSSKLFIIFVFFVAPIGGLLSRLGKKLKRRASHALQDNSTLGEWIQQRLLGLETIKQYHTENREWSDMQTASHNLYLQFLRASRLKSQTSPLIECLGIIAMAVALGVAFHDIASGAISGAVAMSFFSSLALFGQSSAKLGRYFNSNREGLAAADRIFKSIHGLERAAATTLRSRDVRSGDRGSIVLDRVTVAYGKHVAVHNFSFTFYAGRVYCLVGASGSGKSSIFNAILGLKPVEGGLIKCVAGPGFEQRTLDMAYMPQQIPVIPATIGETVAYPLMEYDDERVRQALELVHFDLSKDRLVDGLQTVVGPSGLQLSGGQYQRLLLARLAYQNAPFVLIDEGTSALDPEMEKTVLAYTRELAKRGAVVIMIAHRRAAVDASDEILVLNSGRLAYGGERNEAIHAPEFLKVFK